MKGQLPRELLSTGHHGQREGFEVLLLDPWFSFLLNLPAFPSSEVFTLFLAAPDSLVCSSLRHHQHHLFSSYHATSACTYQNSLHLG